MTRLFEHLALLYGERLAVRLLERTQNVLAEYRARIQPRGNSITERDCILITYGDQVQAPKAKPLRILRAFCEQHLKDVVSGIHILPFYPSTSDDGFSVADYRKVDSALGEWEDISSLQNDFRLMFDAVINHVSTQSEWFQGFLRGDPRYRDYFIVVEGSPDLSQVVRPRALPLLATFDTSSGEKRVWTTFSADQVDLNYRNPEVLLEMLDVLLTYAERGADFIRLDAIAYLWKEIGTTCLHLPQTHRVVRFLRAALDEVASHVHLVTETNVPHADNISYFGDGYNEAQLVYNFALPPLTLHAFHAGDARLLSDWARTLTPPSAKATFLNFLASHDGIGLNPVRGILSEADIDSLVDKTIEHGGFVSYKHEPDGSNTPYELNINYFDALSNPNEDEPLDLQVDRFMAAQAMMLSLVGVPGIYFHSLFGSRGWPEGVAQTGRNRAVNRRKYRRDQLESELADKNSLRARVFARYCRLLKARSGTPAFHPHGRQNILGFHPSVFAVERISADGTAHVFCLHNVGREAASFSTNYQPATDVFTGRTLSVSQLTLAPYQVLWIKL